MEQGYGVVLEGFRKEMGVRAYAEATAKAYGQSLRTFFGWLGGRGVMDVRRVGLDDLRAYQAHLLEKYGERRAVQSVRVRAVKRLFEWLEASGKVLVNPAEGIQEPKKARSLPRGVLTVEEVERLLAVPDLMDSVGVRDRAILEVLYSAGLRLGELVRLKMTDLDLQGGLVRVLKGKGNKDRVVPMGESAVRFVRAYLANVRPKWAPEGCEWVWVSRMGRRVSGAAVAVRVKGSGKAAGLKVTPHQLRHTFATHLVAKGAPVEVVSKMLGHTRLEMTQRYARVAAVDVKAAHESAHPGERGEAAPVPEAETSGFYRRD
jgi:integrase/recombinase XerD